MTRIISFHRKPQRYLTPPFILSEVLATISLVVILGVLVCVAAMWYSPLA
jgi:hypothetical protein